MIRNPSATSKRKRAIIIGPQWSTSNKYFITFSICFYQCGCDHGSVDRKKSSNMDYFSKHDLSDFSPSFLCSCSKGGCKFCEVFIICLSFDFNCLLCFHKGDQRPRKPLVSRHFSLDREVLPLDCFVFCWLVRHIHRPFLCIVSDRNNRRRLDAT